jgi:hypothetical protein
MARGHPTPIHYRRQLCQGPFHWLGLQIWSSGHHHIRQRGPIHICPVGGPVQLAQHQALTHDSIPSLIQWVGRTVPQAAEGRLAVRAATAYWHDHLPWVLLGIRASFREDSEFSPAEAVFSSQLILPGQFVDTTESLSPSFLEDLQTAMAGHPPPPTRHNSAPAPSTLPKELLLARFVLRTAATVPSLRRT